MIIIVCRNAKHTWYLAIAFALAESQLTFEDLQPFRKDYTESKEYKRYLKKNPGHLEEVKKLRESQ